LDDFLGPRDLVFVNVSEAAIVCVD
jgi:hypothetical protein